MRRVGIFIVMFFALLGIGYGQVMATGCEVVAYECGDPTGQSLTCYYDGCGGQWTPCESGTYQAPDGSCHDIGEGDGCPCGPNTQGTGCKSCGGGGPACPGPFNCPSDRVMFAHQATLLGDRWSPSCRVGTGQSSRCVDNRWIDDETKECSAIEIYQYGCCPAGQTYQCELVDQNRTYTITTTLNSEGCEDEYDTFLSQVDNWAYVTKYSCHGCNGDGEDCEGCGWNTRAEWTTSTNTCYDVDRVCECKSQCDAVMTVTQGASAAVANVEWTVGNGGSLQYLMVDEDQAEVTGGCTTPNDCEVNATLAGSTRSYIVTGLLPETTYYFRLTTSGDGSCTGGKIATYTTPDVTLSGIVYLDANNVCSTSTPWSLGGLTVSVRGTDESGSVGSDGRFGIFSASASPIDYLDLTGYGSGYVPSTAVGCNHGATLTSVDNPSTTNYFYLTPKREPWWQVVGASVYAQGNVRSELPSASMNLIEAGAGGAVGALMRSSGSVDTGVGSVSTDGYSATTRYRGKVMNYDFFAAQMGVTPNTTNDWVVDTMSKPANDPNKVFYYINPSGSEASVSVPWTVAAGESYVIFVNGDLRIASDIVVEDGGFLAFIVNGSVRVSPAVTDIAGLLVVDNTLITESNGATDVAANFQGSVVVWGGVNLGRDLVLDNLIQPGETFTYRADLLTNMPESMKVFALKWEEVVPGTIGQ